MSRNSLNQKFHSEIVNDIINNTPINFFKLFQQGKYQILWNGSQNMSNK